MHGSKNSIMGLTKLSAITRDGPIVSKASAINNKAKKVKKAFTKKLTDLLTQRTTWSAGK
jgi:hypothetical protein